jgi:hypothetical protein
MANRYAHIMQSKDSKPFWGRNVLRKLAQNTLFNSMHLMRSEIVDIKNPLR